MIVMFLLEKHALTELGMSPFNTIGQDHKQQAKLHCTWTQEFLPKSQRDVTVATVQHESVSTTHIRDDESILIPVSERNHYITSCITDPICY